MILAYCEDPSFRSLVASLNPIVHCDWSAFERDAVQASRLVLVVESLVDWPHIESIRALRIRTPDVPWILATLRDEKNLLELRKIEVEEVVGLTDPQECAAVVLRARVGILRPGLARTIASHGKLTHHERRLLRVLFLESPPPRNYLQWARVAFCSPSTIKYHFGRCRARGGLTASLAINLNLLFSALESAPKSRSWPKLAAMVDVDSRRLRRVCRRLTGAASAQVPSIRDLVQGFVRLLDGVGKDA